jgi:hypothetical protein
VGVVLAIQDIPGTRSSDQTQWFADLTAIKVMQISSTILPYTIAVGSLSEPHDVPGI